MLIAVLSLSKHDTLRQIADTWRLNAHSIVPDLMAGFTSLFRVEVLGGRDRFLMGCKATRVC